MGPINREVPFEQLVRVQQMNSGHHLEAAASPGVLVAAGPGIRAGSSDPDAVSEADLELLASVFQITPTLLYLRGVPVGRDMAAGPIESLLSETLLADRPVEWIDTHEGFAGPVEPDLLAPEMEGKRMERCNALGYIGG